MLTRLKNRWECGCFKNVGYDPSPETGLEIEQWINKWQPVGLSAKWIKFINNTNNTHPGINYPLTASSPGANKKISCESLYEGLHEVVHHIIGAQRGVGYERSG
jgi:hypothetical protein